MDATLRIDLRRLYYVKSLNVEQLEALGIFKSIKNKKDKKSQYEKIQAFVKSIISHKGVKTFDYTCIYKDTNGEFFGRKVALHSPQNIKNEIRDFLLGDTTTDIDEVCSHITTARYLGRKYELKLEGLEHYWKNYKYIKELKGKQYKQDVLSMLNRDDDDETLKRIKDVDKRKIGQDFKTLRDLVVPHEDFKHLIDAEKVKEWNDVGSKMSRILTYYEDKKMECLRKVITRHNIQICFPMYDGMEIYGNHYDNNELLREVEREIEILYPSMEAKYVFKEHDKTIEMPDDFDENLLELVSESRIDDTQASMIIEEYMNEFIVIDTFDDNYAFYIYDEEDGYWKSGNSFVPKLLNYCMPDGKYGQYLWYLDDEGNKSHYLSKNKFTKDFLELLKARNKLVKKDWATNNEKASHGKLLLEDAVLQLVWKDGNKTIKQVEKSPEHCFLTPPIPLSYSKYMNYLNNPVCSAEFGEAIKYVKEKIFEAPYLHPEEGEGMMNYLGRSIWATGIQDKDLLFVEGLTNSGKGVLTSYLSSIYTSIFSEIAGTKLVQQKGTQEDDRVNAFLVGLIGKRIVVANEIPKNKKYDTTLLKKISSGGDVAEGRKIYKEAIKMKISFKFIQFCNKLVPVESDGDENGVAIKGRLRILKMYYSFTDKKRIDEGDIPEERRREPDLDLKSNSRIDKYRYAFFHLINNNTMNDMFWNSKATELSNKYRIEMDDVARTLTALMEHAGLMIRTYNKEKLYEETKFIILQRDLKELITNAIKQQKSIDPDMDKDMKQPTRVMDELIKRYKLHRQVYKGANQTYRDSVCIWGIKCEDEDEDEEDV